MVHFFRLFSGLAAFCLSTFAQDAPKPEIEISKPLPPAHAMGTAAYKSTEKESVFQKKITEKPINYYAGTLPRAQNISDAEWAKMQKEMEEQKKKLIPMKDYKLVNQAGEYVGWFGIVRQAAWDEKKGVTTLLLEHKYFDGAVDLDIHIVSIYGGGDFNAVLSRKVAASEIPPLALVRVFGKVTKGSDGVPVVTVEHVREWNWGLFTFMDYGKDQTNPKWTATRKTNGQDAYDPRPSTQFYEEWLGKREAAK